MSSSLIFPDPAEMPANQLAWTFVTYGYILFCAANLMSDGSELLLFVPKLAGVVGSIVLPVLGAVPDGMMVLFSGLGDTEKAQENVSVGVGALAGSTIMLLTVPWFLSVVGGRVDLKDGKANYGGDPKLTVSNPVQALFKTGIRCQEQIRANGKIMLITSLTYFIIQIPAFYADNQKTPASLKEIHRENRRESKCALIGMIVCMVEFAVYLYLQYAATLPEPPLGRSTSELVKSKCKTWMAQIRSWMQRADIAPAPLRAYTAPALFEKAQRLGIQGYMAEFREQYRLDGTREANERLLAGATFDDNFRGLLRYFFGKYADKTSHKMSRQDFDRLLKDLSLYSLDQAKMFEQVDVNRSGDIDGEEFVECFKLLAALPPFAKEEKKQGLVLAHGDDEEEAEEEREELPEELKDLSPEEQRRRILFSSCYQMGLGTLLVLIFSDPMVDVLSEIGKKSGVPAFYISFVLAPLASNASELVAAYNYAAKKTSKTITISLSTLEGAACMNNTFCLGIFLALIYFQGLAWKFTAETIAIVAVQLFMFLIVAKSPVQSVFTAVVVILMYPASLALVYFLENVVGLD